MEKQEKYQYILIEKKAPYLELKGIYECAFIQSDQGHHFLFTPPLVAIEYFDRRP